jgi:type I restriction enzyme, R subunit
MRTERATQNRVVRLLSESLRYRYLGNLEQEDNSNIREEDLSAWLSAQGKYSEGIIKKAIFQFKKAAEINPQDDLYDINRRVYTLLRYGVKLREEAGEQVQTVRLINWQSPKENDFAVAEEVSIRGTHHKRP